MTSESAVEEEIVIQVGENVTLQQVLYGKHLNLGKFNKVSFREHCRRQYVLELVDFIDAVAEMKVLTNQEDIEKESQRIFDTFVKTNSPNEINISWSLRKQVEEGFEKKPVDVTVFDDAVKEIERVLQTDVWPRFVDSVLTKMRLAVSRQIAMWWKDPPTLAEFFTFPDPVNALESRIHNFTTTILIVLTLLLQYFLGIWYVDILILYGFVARTSCGPRLDPQAMIVLFVIRPFVENVLHLGKSEFRPGPPYRFAQFCGAVMSLIGLILHSVGQDLAATIVWGLFLLIAFIAAAFDLCMGCQMFKLGMKLGLIPESVCDQCAVQYSNKQKTGDPNAACVLKKRTSSADSNQTGTVPTDESDMHVTKSDDIESQSMVIVT